MHESSLDYLRCVNCGSELKSNVFEKRDEIKEGLLSCIKCEHLYPVISNIPILWKNLSLYLSNRASLGGYLLNQAKEDKLKLLVKESLKKIKKDMEDVTAIEKRWITTYKNSLKSNFYTYIKKAIKKIPQSDLVLEHGCSIGYVTKFLAQKHGVVFGIDQSFFAIAEAKKNQTKNLDFFVANSLFPPFGKTKFGLVVGLNILELIEPTDLLGMISSQTQGFAVISDPYDFERGKNSVKQQIDSRSLRDKLKKLDFTLVHNTRKPSFIPWKLNVNSRLSLNYKVDFVVAKKS